jgi:dihydroorotate dehydrogenase (NAD+) catalytic subunit
VIAKLAPGAAAPAALARSCEAAGASALTISNTLPAMAYEPGTSRQALGGIAGGMSGPALRPVSLLMVYRASRAVRIPVIGAGGIGDGSSAHEYLLAGARAVQVGTANILEPGAARRINQELTDILRKRGRNGE